MMVLFDEIRTRLASLETQEVSIHDDSAAHAGHAGNRGGGHIDLLIVSECFSGKRSVDRHRMVYALLADLIPQHIHALSLKALAPDEF
ncbi:MAG: BolA family transcriptional regulator [Formivibrio sp.]|nr:BolA family transcriptional regulator [Formivibrio sp.]